MGADGALAAAPFRFRNTSGMRVASSEHTTGTPEPPTRGTTPADAEITCEQYTGENFARTRPRRRNEDS